MTLEMGIGVSCQADVSAAGHEAAGQMMSHLGTQPPGLVIVFSSVRFADPRMLKAVRAATAAAPLIGCTDAGGIVTAGPKRSSVIVIGLAAPEGTFVTGVERNLSHGARACGERLVESLIRQTSREPRCLLVFPDGLSVSGTDVVAGIENKIAKDISLTGAAAADDLYFQKTFQFYNGEILTDGMPGVLLCGDIHVGIGVRHGWIPVGRPRRVTHSTGRIVYQLDGRPAVSIYEDFLGLKRDELMQEPLAHVTLPYPLGTEMPGQSEYLLRDAIRVGRAGSLICTGDVPEGSQVHLMIGGYESALEAAQQAACDAKDRLSGARLRAALVFCSVARQNMLGSEFQGEIDVIRDSLGGAGVRLAGFYSYGEFAPNRVPPSTGLRARRGNRKSATLFHNESVVVVALG